MKNRCIARKEKNYHIVRESVRLQTNDVQILMRCLHETGQLVQNLLGSVELENDEDSVKKTTVRTVQELLTSIANVNSHPSNAEREPTSCWTIRTHTTGLLTETSSRSRRTNDPLEQLIKSANDDDRMESDISAPDSSFEEDFDVEISEPEEDIDCATELVRQLSEASKGQVDQSLRSEKKCDSDKTDTNGDRLHVLWSTICRSPLGAYLPGSRSWRDLLSEYLLLSFWDTDLKLILSIAYLTNLRR